VKDTRFSKQRLADVLSTGNRQMLALAMLRDVLAALAATPGLARIMVVTEDPAATQIARDYGMRVSIAGARDGHTGAVSAAAGLLAGEGLGMLALPADIPLVAPADIVRVLESHAQSPAFTIVPAHDLQGSNAVLCTPADAVPLRFGTNSYFPHLAAARACGIVPREVRVPCIERDVDTPEDLAACIAAGGHTSAHRFLAEIGYAPPDE
jgi:2-phospho-L-lactate guanylyltransferase